MPSVRAFDLTVNCAPDEDLGAVVRVRVTHSFHPLFGRELEFVKRRRNWRADRVYVFDPNGLLLSLPVEWTDVAGEDPFVVVLAKFVIELAKEGERDPDKLCEGALKILRKSQ